MLSADERDLIVAACAGGRPNRAGFVRVNCPVCPSRVGKADRDVSLGYRPLTGGFRCFRCGINGRMSGAGYVLPTEVPVDPDAPSVAIPYDDFFPLWTNDGWAAESLRLARQYMLRRGFTRAQMAEADVHVAMCGAYRDRIVLPHKDAAGAWWGFTARTYAGTSDMPKVLYPKHMDRTRMYNEQVLFDSTPAPVMVVEGCLDSLWYLPLCVAALGKPTQDHFETLLRASRPVVFCLDGDAWEMGQALTMRMRLRSRRAAFVRLPAGEDPNSVDPVWLRGEVATIAAAWRDEACTQSTPSL